MLAEYWLAESTRFAYITLFKSSIESIFHVEFATERTLSGQFAKENL